MNQKKSGVKNSRITLITRLAKEPFMKKVAVTGLGVICPLGDSVAAAWEAMLAGKVGTGKLELIDPAPYRVKIGGEIKDRRRIENFEKEHRGRYERSAVLSILAAQEALAEATLTAADLDILRVGSFLGTTMGSVQLAERLSDLNFQKKSEEIKPDSFHQ